MPIKAVQALRRPALSDPNAIRDFERFFAAHGGSGYGEGTADEIDEARKLEILPLVFALIPRAALLVPPGRARIRPVIEAHLASIGIAHPSDLLIRIIKRSCEQLVLSNRELASQLRLTPRRKYGVVDLRAQGTYRKVEEQQAFRCPLCGIRLAEAESVELDHVIPYYLVGDVPDGSNWRLLCGTCNNGKHAYLSALQATEAWNWIAPQGVADAAQGSITNRTRYAVLALQPSCSVPYCDARPDSGRMWVQSCNVSGLPVLEFLAVFCEAHRQIYAIAV